jgi:arylsulfatase
MNRRQFLQAAGFCAIGMSQAGCLASKHSKEGKRLPNILLILADDMGWSDIGCYGGEVKTPNLDRLAANGIRFRQFHNTAKCMPSRACLLTGVYAQQCGMMKPEQIKNAVTLGEVLRPAGYRTLWVGKHHGTENPVTRGFDRYFGLRDGCCNYFNPGTQRPGEGKPACKRNDRAWCIDDKTYEPYTPPEKDFYTTDYFTNYALDYLEQYKNEDKPFFLYVAYTAPHDPLMAWPEDIAKYKDTYKVGYEAIRQKRYQRQLHMGLVDRKTYPLSEPTYATWDSLSEDEKKEQALTMAVYAAMVDRMDQNIGKLLDQIEQLGETENTLVIFASDNGASAEVVRRGLNVPGEGPIGSMTRWTSQGGDWANVSNTPLRYYKNYSHEGGINTPLIAHWPAGIKNPGRFSDFAGHFIDIMPTLLQITGAAYPETCSGQAITPVEGISFAPVFAGEESNRDKPLFWQWARGRAVRQGKWKLVSFGEPPEKAPWELYDMAADKTETNNLAKKHPQIVKELEQLYLQWYQDVQQER